MSGFSDESGFTLTELLITMATSLVILTAVVQMVTVATQNQADVAKRVDANQRGRPVMTRLIDQMHSACVAPGIAPVLAGSSSSSVQFVSKAGNSVSPTPDKYVISLSGTTLSRQIFPATGGAAPSWTFSGTPSSTTQLLTDVWPGSIGAPPAAVPLFRYYAFVGGQVSSTPLAVPLSAADAAKTVQVNIAFAVAPSANAPSDSNASVTLSDTVTMRLEPASEDASEVNLPCV